MRSSLPERLHLRRSALGLGVPIVMASLVLVVLRTYNPATTWFYPPCAFRALTGYLCPGCGTLRAIHQLLNGHFAAAFRLNPLMLLLLPGVAYAAISSALELAGAPALPRVFLRPIYIWMLLAVIIAFWILRNIPAIAALGGG